MKPRGDDDAAGEIGESVHVPIVRFVHINVAFRSEPFPFASVWTRGKMRRLREPLESRSFCSSFGANVAQW